MPSLAKGLTDNAVRNAKRKDKRYTLADGVGLHLEVRPSGRKSWFARYRLPEGKQRTVVLGSYPSLSLAEARQKAEEVQLAGRIGEPIIGARVEAKNRLNAHTAEQDLALQAAEAKHYSFARLSDACVCGGGGVGPNGAVLDSPVLDQAFSPWQGREPMLVKAFGADSPLKLSI